MGQTGFMLSLFCSEDDTSHEDAASASVDGFTRVRSGDATVPTGQFELWKGSQKSLAVIRQNSIRNSASTLAPGHQATEITPDPVVTTRLGRLRFPAQLIAT